MNTTHGSLNANAVTSTLFIISALILGHCTTIESELSPRRVHGPSLKIESQTSWAGRYNGPGRIHPRQHSEFKMLKYSSLPKKYIVTQTDGTLTSFI